MEEEYKIVVTCDNTGIDSLDFELGDKAMNYNNNPYTNIVIPEQYLYVDDTWGDVMEEFNFNLQEMAVEILRLRERLGQHE